MRQIISLNEGWRFSAERGGADFQTVNIPHTWNNMDGQDGGNDYKRGTFWYAREFSKPEDLEEDRLFLDFGAVNSIAEVFVNGLLLAHHEGGYSRFRVDITEALHKDKPNLIEVSADNADSDHVYPSWADFTFFGGIYRDVALIRVPRSHFELGGGVPGIIVTSKLEGETALVHVNIDVHNVKHGQRLALEILGDNAPDIIYSDMSDATGELDFYLNIPEAHRWNGRKDPYLYKAVATLSDDEGELDQVETEFGLREFSVDPEQGFFLNGESYPLHGVCRHQDRLNMGWAITKKEHEEDIRLILEVGANTIRLAHYQHDEYFYTLCDRTGLVVWAEIPFISAMLPSGHENELSQMRELVTQNINHASIICWGLSNEITIEGDVTEEVINRHKELNELCHHLDPTRLTTMAQVSMLPIDSPMNEISDLRSYNIYYGWYGGEVSDNAPWIDKFHEANPTLPLGISEYGCEAILKWHSDVPEAGDYSEEYQAYYHEEMLKVLMNRPFLWATHVWNMFDFGCDRRDEGGVAGRNNKGLVSYDRKTKKDSFYIYKAWWSEEPTLHLCGRRYVEHAAKEVSVKLYTNQPSAALYVNNKLIGTGEAENHIIRFENVPLHLGKNKLFAVSKLTDGSVISDEMELKRVLKPNDGYVLAKAGEGGSVKNWFDTELTFPEGYFSINDKIGDIMKNPEGAALFEKLSEKVMEKMGDKVPKMSESTMKMAYGFTIRRVIGMVGEDKIPKEYIIKLNQELNQIKK